MVHSHKLDIEFKEKFSVIRRKSRVLFSGNLIGIFRSFLSRASARLELWSFEEIEKEKLNSTRKTKYQNINHLIVAIKEYYKI
ncbi:hypothetical protein EO98_07535 [Methanosarcina sp. 2.H.T.1A.6]|nr:hypothetical protein EO98_07535 [Methanosarcina sp. 2.H.T.1A.6]KKG22948.1 hypothetical protein EO96_08750 [Methanosarcina sp. 2.H.T.1A.8]KKG25015.1 hypothetical protein EO97_19525 [Methanosarcina sp. 2.H.T.1A.15]